MSEEKKNEKLEVVFAPKADSNLDQIGDYITDNSEANIAKKVVDKIVDVCHKLADFPHSGRARNEIRPGVRSITSGSYVIYYRVEGERFEILRVWHADRNIASLRNELS